MLAFLPLAIPICLIVMIQDQGRLCSFLLSNLEVIFQIQH